MVNSTLVKQNNACVYTSSEQISFLVVLILHNSEIKTHYASWIRGSLNELFEHRFDIVLKFFEIKFILSLRRPGSFEVDFDKSLVRVLF